MSKTFLITTPFYIANKGVDLAGCYTAVIGDAIARHKRALGLEVTSLAGIDHHGAGTSPLSEPDSRDPGSRAGESPASVAPRDTLAALRVVYTSFVGTDEEAHQKALAELFRRLEHSRFVTISRNTGGAVCSSCACLVPVTEPCCPDCGADVEPAAGGCHVFRLSAFQEKLLGFYQDNPDYVLPTSRMNEILSIVKTRLEDVYITTPGGQGVRVPGTDGEVFAAWVSRLAGYLSGSGFPDGVGRGKAWPADVQLAPRESLRIHAIYWPALLMAAGLEPPRHILSHAGWSLDPESRIGEGRESIAVDEIAELLPGDYIRYFLLREAPLGSDAVFSYEALMDRVNADLASEFGILASRVFKMIENYFGNTIPEPGDLKGGEENLRRFCVETVQLYRENFERFQISRALETVGELVSVINKYVLANEPWVLARDTSKKDRLGAILYSSAEALRIACMLLEPVVPDTISEVLKRLGIEYSGAHRPSAFSWGELRSGRPIGSLDKVFPRIDIREFESRLMARRQREESVAQDEQAVPDAGKSDDRISIEDFAKVEMRVAKVLAAERVPQSEKLIKLQVDVGTGTRQIVAGIGKAYAPEGLVGRMVVVVTNLKPAKLMGIVSDGMIVAASQGGVPVLIGFNEPVEIGARLK